MRESSKKIQYVASKNLSRGEVLDPTELIQLTLGNDLEAFKEYVTNHPEVINIKETNHGNVALHIASSKGNSSMVTFLLSKGANCNIQDIFGNTSLHYATDKRHLLIIEILLNHRADVNQPDYRGNTPLHIACQHNDLSIVKLLMLHNANPEISDLSNLRPIDKTTIPAIKQMIEKKIQANNGAENEGTQQTMQWMSLGIGLGVGLGMAMAKQQQFFLEQQIRIMQLQNQNDRKKKFIGVQHSTSNHIENGPLPPQSSQLFPSMGNIPTTSQHGNNQMISFNPTTTTKQMSGESNNNHSNLMNSSSRRML